VGCRAGPAPPFRSASRRSAGRLDEVGEAERSGGPSQMWTLRRLDDRCPPDHEGWVQLRNARLHHEQEPWRGDLQEQPEQRGAAAPDATARLLQEQERRVKNLYEGLAKMGWSQGLAAQIRSEEGKLSALRLKSTERARPQPSAIPHPKIICSKASPSKGVRSWPATFNRSS
jgi:hypothetical protein